MKDSTRKIAVIGAGIAGLLTAKKLQEAGYSVKVFEKSRGSGGRASTRRQGDYRFDHGAQYFTARDARFTEQVRKWIQDGVVERWMARIVAIRDGKSALDKASIDRYVGVPGMNAISKALADGIDVTYGSRIERIIRIAQIQQAVESQNAWQLIDSENKEHGPFDGVIVTTPPAQAAPLVSVAPNLQKQVGEIYLDPCWAVMVVFDHKLNFDFDGAFVHQSPLNWIARNNSKPGRPKEESWVLHAGPDWSRQHLETKPEDVSKSLLGAFFRITGVHPVTPVFLNAHRWRYSIARNPLSQGCLWDKDLGIGLAGDWCHESRIEGAYLSGLRLFEHIVNSTD